MNELTEAQEALLAECFRAIEQGADPSEALARYPEHAEALRPYLELRSRLLSLLAPDPSPAQYDAGRQALLARVARPAPVARERALRPAARRPLVRFAAAASALFVLALGALSASAAVGVKQAQDVLSVLPFVEPAGDGQAGPNADDGINNAPDAADTGRDNANDRASEGGDNAEEAPGAGPCIPQHVLDLLPFLQPLVAPEQVCANQDAGPPTDVPTPHGPPITPPGQAPDGPDQLTPQAPVDPHSGDEPPFGPPASVPGEDDAGGPPDGVAPPDGAGLPDQSLAP